MLEVGVVLGLLALVVGAPVVLSLWPWEYVFGGGWALVAIGMALGVPTGFWYHVALYRRLRPHGPLPSGWWWHPTQLHGRLSEAERPGVLVWFLLGGIGFLIAIGGVLLVAVGLVRS